MDTPRKINDLDPDPPFELSLGVTVKETFDTWNYTGNSWTSQQHTSWLHYSEQSLITWLKVEPHVCRKITVDLKAGQFPHAVAEPDYITSPHLKTIIKKNQTVEWTWAPWKQRITT